MASPPEVPTRARPRHAAKGRARPASSPQLWPALVLIAAETLFVAVWIHRSFFSGDSFLTFVFVHQEGLSFALFKQQIFGHIAPAERFLSAITLRIAPLDWTVGLIIEVALFAWLMLSLNWVLRELRAASAVILTVLFVVGTSTVVMWEIYSFDQTIFLLPATAFILSTVAPFIRWVRTGSTRWLVMSWVVFALSLVTQERVLVALVYLVVLRYLVLPWRDAPGARRRYLGDWRIWAPFALLGGGYLLIYLDFAPGQSGKLSSLPDFYAVGINHFAGFTMGYFPFSDGATVPPRWQGALVWCVIAVGLAALVVAWRRKPRLQKATLFLALAFFGNLFAVFHGIGGVYGPNGIVNQVQFYLDPLFGAAVAAGILSSPLTTAPVLEPYRSPERALPIPSDHSKAVTLACVAVAAIHAVILPVGLSAVWHDTADHRMTANWFANFIAGVNAESSSATGSGLIPLTVPPWVTPSFESPGNTQQSVLSLMGTWKPGVHAPVTVANAEGLLVHAVAGGSETLEGGAPLSSAVVAEAQVRTVPGPANETCFEVSPLALGSVTIRLPQLVKGSQLAMDLHIEASQAMVGTPFSTGSTGILYNPLPVQVPKGSFRMMTEIVSSGTQEVGLTNLSPGAHLCMSTLQVGAVEINLPATASCAQVNSFGAVAVPVRECGVAWR